MYRLTCMAFLIFPLFLNAQQIENSYYYFDQQVSLEVDLTAISVTYNDNNNQKMQNLSRAFSTVLQENISTIKPIAAGKNKIEFKDRISEELLYNYLNGLNKLDNVRMAAPILKNRNVHQAITDEFIVHFKKGVSLQHIQTLNETLGGQVIKEIRPGTYLLRIPKSSGLNGLTAANLYYSSSESVNWAEPDFIYLEGDLLHATVNDPLHSQQWAHVNTGQSVPTESSPANVNGLSDADMDVDQAWDISSGSSDIIVAIIDSGVDLDHPDLDDNLVAGTDASGDGDGPDAPGNEAHGTNCAGLVAAEGNNSVGIAGVAYSCSIMPVQIFNSAGSASISGIATGIDFAWQNDAAVLSNSWGGGSPSATITSAIGDAKSMGRNGDGCVILFSSGNDGIGEVSYPAYLSDVIAVGASSMLDEKKNPGSGDAQYWWGGNYGPTLDMVAPTICISTDIIGNAGYSNGDYYETFNGTSAACPNAAGVAALVLSADPSLSSDEVQNILESTADKIDNYSYDSGGWNKHVGYGRVNAYKAVLAAIGDDGDEPVIAHVLEQSSSNTSSRTITATITDAAGLAGGADQPTLYYRLTGNDGSSSWIAVTDINGPSGDTYEFIIPGQNQGIMVEYYISATDNSAFSHTATFPFGGSGSSTPPRLLKYWVATLSTMTYNSGDAGMWNSQPGSHLFDLNIPDDFTIIDLDFTMDFEPRFPFGLLIDFVMVLEHPDGQRAGLVGYNDGDSYSGTTLDDEAGTALIDGNATHSGSFTADNRLDVFDALSSLGTWQYRIYDSYPTGGGDLNSWSIQITYTSDDVPLPVELSSFSVISAAGNARLEWQTAAEINNSGFVIVRSGSSDGQYIEIASHLTDESLKGLGTSSVGRHYSYTDFGVSENETYWYKIIDVDYAGQQKTHGPLQVYIEKHEGIKAISAFIPARFSLQQNYPNPFNPATQFVVNIPQSDNSQHASIDIYNLLGKKIKTLFSGDIAAGQYIVNWDGSNNHGQLVPAGMYIYSFISAEFKSARRMLLVK